MAIEDLTTLIDMYRNELAYQIARTVTNNNPERIEQVAKVLEPSIEALVNYLRSGNFETYKQYITNSFIEMFARGTPVENIQKASDVFFIETKALVERIWTSPDEAKIKSAALRRLDSIQQMQMVALITSNIKKAAPHNN